VRDEKIKGERRGTGSLVFGTKKKKKFWTSDLVYVRFYDYVITELSTTKNKIDFS